MKLAAKTYIRIGQGTLAASLIWRFLATHHGVAYPDFAFGLMMGVGIGLNLLGLVRLRRGIAC